MGLDYLIRIFVNAYEGNLLGDNMSTVKSKDEILSVLGNKSLWK
jgi:hypothetical protein